MSGAGLPSPMPGAPGAGPTPGQPPIGASPATAPVPNRGHEAAGIAQVSVIVHLMEKALPLTGVSTEVGKDLLSCLQKLAKHVPPGQVSPGIQGNALAGIQNQVRQMGPMIAQMRQGGGGDAPPPPPGAA